MSDTKSHTGRCLCGAVRYTAMAAKLHTGACHCTMCRRWTGGPLHAINVGSDIVFEGSENIGIYRSSKWAERGFCKICGSSLFYRTTEGLGGAHFLATGTLDDQSEIALTNQVFIDEKPAFYSFEQETKDMTGAEIFAMYGSPDQA